jgi:1,4-dihydroxy-2-naphthoyl-CoA synthase
MAYILLKHAMKLLAIYKRNINKERYDGNQTSRRMSLEPFKKKNRHKEQKILTYVRGWQSTGGHVLPGHEDIDQTEISTS